MIDHLQWMEKAKLAGARLVLFPELSLTGYSCESYVPETALRFDSEECGAVVRKANQIDIYCSFGMALNKDGKVFISHVLAGPAGMMGHYEKVHLAFPHRNEGTVYSPGDFFGVFDVDGICVGINICMDGRFPGSSMSLSHLGAEIILHPHGNYSGDLCRNPRDWTRKKHAYLGPRAIDTCTYSLICNSVGRLRSRSGKVFDFCGGALVIAPGGEVAARSSTRLKRAHMVVCDLDIEGLRKRRKERDTFRSMWRPEVYMKALSTGSG